MRHAPRAVAVSTGSAGGVNGAAVQCLLQNAVVVREQLLSERVQSVRCDEVREVSVSARSCCLWLWSQTTT